MPQRMSSTVRGGASAATGEAVVPSLAIVLGGALLFALVNGTAGRASAWLAIAATVLAVALVVTLQRGGADIAFGAIADWTLAAVPGLLVVFFSFDGGGFFPGSQGLVAFLLSVALALRIALVPSPFSGISRVGAVAVGCLLLYALVELVSGSWSHAWGRAFVAFGTSLLYALTVAVFTAMPRSSMRIRWMARGVAAGAVVVCTCALITRLLPHVWPIAPNLGEDRLSYPLTYWNALGILAGTGLVLAVYAATSLRDHPVVMALGSAAVPLTATTVYFTFSRGAIGGTAIALVVFLAVARPRGLVGGLLAAGPTTAIALNSAYGANLLSSTHATSPGAVSQGHHVAGVLAACIAVAALLRLLLVPLDRLLVTQFRIPSEYRRIVARGGWAAAAFVVVVVLIAGSHKIDQQWSRFVSKTQVSKHVDLRTRLTDPSSNHRIDQWRVGMRSFRTASSHENGAGTYQITWAKRRPDQSTVQNAHSLYVESLSETGVVGTLLLAAALVALLVGVARQVRAVNRSLYAAVLAVTIGWLIHAGVDWDWQMPAETLPVMALAAAAVARSSRRGPFAPPVLPVRAAAVTVASVLGVVPVMLAVSEHHLDAALESSANGKCPAAIRSAQASVDALGKRAEPYQHMAYCEQEEGHKQAALADVRKAIDRDPQFWRHRFDEALIAGAFGDDPRPALNRARALDPREQELGVAHNVFTFLPRSRWKGIAKKAIAQGS